MDKLLDSLFPGRFRFCFSGHEQVMANVNCKGGRKKSEAQRVVFVGADKCKPTNPAQSQNGDILNLKSQMTYPVRGTVAFFSKPSSQCLHAKKRIFKDKPSNAYNRECNGHCHMIQFVSDLLKKNIQLKFRHTNSVLCCVQKSERAECVAGTAIPVTHLIQMDYITQKKLFGVISRGVSAEFWGELAVLKSVNAGINHVFFQSLDNSDHVLCQRQGGNGKSNKQNNGKESFWVAERIQKRQHNILKFRHKNSVLCWLKKWKGGSAAGTAIPVAHLIQTGYITQKKSYGVISRGENAEKRGKSIIYCGCAVFLSCLLFASPVLSDVPARVLYVIDGDTFKARVNVNGQFYQTSVRVAHIDTPETKYAFQCDAERQAGFAATRFAKTLLKKEQAVLLNEIHPGKYAGRIIANVSLLDGRDYGKIMLQSGHAIPYEGGWKTKVWCDDKANE